jgi:hypothetical protein
VLTVALRLDDAHAAAAGEPVGDAALLLAAGDGAAEVGDCVAAAVAGDWPVALLLVDPQAAARAAMQAAAAAVPARRAG